MVQISFSKREILLKIVYYGMGLCGKTTSLQYLHSVVDPDNTTKLFSVKTEEDRTLFFDFLPITLPAFRNFKVKLKVYTVPGQVKYSATRKAVLAGVDGIVFVADSQNGLMQNNMDSFLDLKSNLESYKISINDIPLIFQYNKRDLSNLISVDDFNKNLNKINAPYFETIATNGTGITDSFTKIATKVMYSTMEKHKLPIDSSMIDNFKLTLQSAFSKENIAMNTTELPTYTQQLKEKEDTEVQVVIPQETDEQDSLLTKAVESSVELANLYDDMEEMKKSLEIRIKQLVTANQLSANIISELEPDRVIDQAANAFLAFDNFGVAILMATSTIGELVEMNLKNLEFDILKNVKLENDITADQLIVSKEKLVFINYQKNVGIYKKVLEVDSNIKSILSIPLIAKNKLLGLLNLYSYSQENFDKGTLYFFNLIGNNIAIAIENAKLHKTLSHLNGILKQKMDEVSNYNEKLEKMVEERTLELKKANIKLKDSIEELRSLDKLKDDFMGLVSHELRTPLTSIMSYSQSIIEGFVEEEEQKKEYTKIIFQESKSLETIIDKVLDTVNLENDRIMINVEPYNSALIISNAISKLENKITEKNIEIVNESQDEFIIIDPMRGEQILTYVIDNAINASKPGDKIKIESYSQDNRYTIYIKDNGPGIPTNMRDVIFEKFKLLETIDKHSKGLGLSLHIAKYIIKKMNGKIYVQNPGEKGAVFALEFKKSN